MIARNPDWFEFVQCILVTKYPAKCLKCLWHNYFILSLFFFIFWLIAVFKIRNNRPQCLMSSSWPFFCASEAWFGGQKCKPATKTIMLHSCDLENCEDTSATMAQKGEIYKKGRTYSMAGAPNDVGFKNNSYIPGISISSFLKDVGVSCNVVSLTLRTVFENGCYEHIPTSQIRWSQPKGILSKGPVVDSLQLLFFFFQRFYKKLA